MLGYSIALYDGDKDSKGKALCYWYYNRDSVSLTYFTDHPEADFYLLGGYPNLFKAPMELIREPLMQLKESPWQKDDDPSLIALREIVESLPDDKMVLIEEWDQS